MKITEITNKIVTLLTNANQIVENMPDQARKRLPDLAVEAGETVGMDGDEALPFITWLAHNSDGVEMSKGRTGGLYKGSKPVPGNKAKNNKAVISKNSEVNNIYNTQSTDSDNSNSDEDLDDSSDIGDSAGAGTDF